MEKNSSPLGESLGELWTYEQLAREIERITGKRPTDRTIRNYCNAPDGLPYIKFGPHRLFNPPTARAWLLGREIQRNPINPRRPGRPKGPARRDQHRTEAGRSP